MSTASTPTELADGKLLIDEPADGRRAPDDLQPGEAQRAGPPDPRRDHRHAQRAVLGAPGDALRRGHGRPRDVLGRAMTSARYPTRSSRSAPSAWSRTRSPKRSTRSRRSPTRRSRSCRATRSAEAWSWRWPAICAWPSRTSSWGCRPAKLGLVYSHTGLRRFIDAIGAARTRELFLLGRYIDAPTALAWGLVNRRRHRPRSWTRWRSSWRASWRATRRSRRAATSA